MLISNRQKLIVRPLRRSDARRLLRMVDMDWRVQLRVAPSELAAKAELLPGLAAEDGVGIRGFVMLEPLPSKVGLIVALGLRDTWRVRPFLNSLLPALEETSRAHGLSALVYIGSAVWLVDRLQERGFKIKEWMVTLERDGDALPPPARPTAARLRPAHLADLPALLRLDRRAFEHIWHKSSGNFSEALARAGSFTVAEIESQIVAYQWCEVYGRHAHLTRLAVAPEFQGQGIGGQLLHRAISDALNLGADWMTLNTQETNRRSLALYHRFGFVDTKQRMPVLCKPIG